MDAACVTLACLFAVLAGANDGCPMLATGLSISRGRPILAYAVLTATVAAVPLAGLLNVATTFTDRMVDLGGPARAEMLATTMLSALAAVLLLTWRGLPTSLTLALIGSLTASALTRGFTVSWKSVGSSLLVAALAPFLAATVARALSGFWRGRSFGATAANLHRISFPAQAFAYAINDGQKMLALMLLATGGTTDAAGWVLPILVAGCFGTGVALGWRRYAGGAVSSVLPMSPEDSVVTEGSAALAVTASAALGAPVSMTQSVMGALVGAGTRHTWRRIRWAAVRDVVLAWLLTLPMGALIALVLSIAARASS